MESFWEPRSYSRAKQVYARVRTGGPRRVWTQRWALFRYLATSGYRVYTTLVEKRCTQRTGCVRTDRCVHAAGSESTRNADKIAISVELSYFRYSLTPVLRT